MLLKISKVVLLAVSVMFTNTFHSQCINTTNYQGGAAPAAGGNVVLTTCLWAGEYSTVTAVASATNYQSTSSIAGDFITITTGAVPAGGTVIASGVTPLNWTSTTTGTYYVHINTGAGCGVASVCRTSTLFNLTPLVSATTGPGGVLNGLQVWLKAESGTTGTSPVTQWDNQGPNTTLTSVVSTTGTNMLSGANHNYNSGIRLAGGANYKNGVFTRTVTNRTSVIPGNEVTMFSVYSDGGYDLTMSFHSDNNSINQWHAFAFRHAGLGTISSGGAASFLYNTPTNRGSNILGFTGSSGSAGLNTFNGLQNTSTGVGTFTTNTGNFEFSIGYWPGYANNNITSENLVYSVELSPVDFHKVESYLAIKYGVTLGVNGTSMDYNLSDNNDIWTQGANSAFAYDIASLARDDIAELSQLKSHSVEGASFGVFNDILTIANGSNFSSPTSIGADLSAFSWGHDNSPTINTGAMVMFPTDNAEVIETIFQREWKSQETGTIGRVVLEFDMSSVVGVGSVVGANDLANLRLLVDEDGDYSIGATSIAPSSFSNVTNIAYFTHDFAPGTANPMDQNNGFFFTIGSTDASTTILSTTLKSQEVNSAGCENIIKWETTFEDNVDFYSVFRSYNGEGWTLVEKVSPYAYNYIVRDSDFPNNGIIYYKIEETDLNGEKIIIGDVLALSAFCLENEEPIIYPNPISNTMTIKSSSNDEMRLFDLNGRLIHKTSIVSGENQLDMSQISSGTYFVEIGNEAKKVFRKKIVKL